MSSNNVVLPNSPTKRTYQEMKDAETSDPKIDEINSPKGNDLNLNHLPQEQLEQESSPTDENSAPELMQLYQDYTLLRKTGHQSSDANIESSQIDPEATQELPQRH